MGKVKSAICLALFTLLIAVLCFVCFVPFNYGNEGMYRFDPIITWTSKDSNFGVSFGAGEGGYYRGGGYATTYYPEGVISVREYENNLAGMEEGKEKSEYENKYTQIGSLCFETEELIENGELTEEFIESFNVAVDMLRERYARLHADIRVEVVDGYTVRVFVPQGSSPNAYTAAFSTFTYTGEMTILYGSDADSATPIMPVRNDETIDEYVSGASARKAVDGTNYVVINFTKKGKQLLKDKTADIGEGGSGVIVIKIGEDDVVTLSVDAQVTGGQLTLANQSSPFSSESATSLAVLFNTTVSGMNTDLALTFKDTVTYNGLYGNNALTYMYIAFGVFFVLMMVFFFVRYRLLAFVHLYTYLLFLFGTILCLWAIPFISISVPTLAAFMITSVLLCASQVMVYETARKEYALGKTIASSVKTAYKKCLWHIFDLHIVVALIGFITYFIAFTQLSAFAFLLGLTAVFSGVGSLLVGRFIWSIMMRFTNKKGAFCNYRRVEVDDD